MLQLTHEEFQSMRKNSHILTAHVTYVRGLVDILTSAEEGDASIVTVNCIGAMDKGIAEQAKKMYPQFARLYEQYCRESRIYPGIVQYYRDPKNGRHLIGFPTKIDWRNPSALHIIEMSLQKLVATYRGGKNGPRGIKRLLFPKVGCGEGKLPWTEVGPLVARYLAHIDDIPVVVVIGEKDLEYHIADNGEVFAVEPQQVGELA